MIELGSYMPISMDLCLTAIEVALSVFHRKVGMTRDVFYVISTSNVNISIINKLREECAKANKDIIFLQRSDFDGDIYSWEMVAISSRSYQPIAKIYSGGAT